MDIFVNENQKWDTHACQQKTFEANNFVITFYHLHLNKILREMIEYEEENLRSGIPMHIKPTKDIVTTFCHLHLNNAFQEIGKC